MENRSDRGGGEIGNEVQLLHACVRVLFRNMAVWMNLSLCELRIEGGCTWHERHLKCDSHNTYYTTMELTRPRSLGS